MWNAIQHHVGAAIGWACLCFGVGLVTGATIIGLCSAAKRGDELCALATECPKRVA